VTLAFGTQVSLTHTLQAHYISVCQHRLSMPDSNPTPGFFQLRSHYIADADATLCYHDVTGGEVPMPENEGIPGEPLDPPSDLPTRPSTYRLLRRHQTPVILTGIVVGHSFRMEGLYDPGSPRGGYYSSEYEPDFPSFEGSRRVPVYEIAMPPVMPDTAHPWPSNIVIAVTSDVTPLR
jgi:hypothetical protein